MYHHLPATRELVMGVSVAPYSSTEDAAAAASWLGRAKIDAQHWHRAGRDMRDRPRVVALDPTEDDSEALVRMLCASLVTSRETDDA